MKYHLGNFPWEHAQDSDVYYKEYIQWHRHYQIQRRYKLPSQWYRFTPRLMRLFRKMLGKSMMKKTKRRRTRSIHFFVQILNH